MQSDPTRDTPSQGNEAPRNFSTISPSAYSLLLMKGLSAIPYARQAAALLLAAKSPAANAHGNIAPDPHTPENPEPRPPLFWARLMHFENRYWNINQLMEQLPITNILELCCGFSFRGLALSRQQPVFYVDTDLPEIITTKRHFVDALTAAPETDGSAANIPTTHTPENNAPATTTVTTPAGHYELQPLNALDEPSFNAIVDRFPPGQILIINEGLLIYLDQPEKETLCRIIHRILQRRGGYWITGDIYIQKEIDPTLIDREDAFHQFLQQHNIEEKKFRDFESAAEFFTRMGFIVDREATTDISKLTAWPRLLASLSPDTQRKLMQTPRMHATWRLRPA